MYLLKIKEFLFFFLLKRSFSRNKKKSLFCLFVIKMSLLNKNKNKKKKRSKSRFVEEIKLALTKDSIIEFIYV